MSKSQNDEPLVFPYPRELKWHAGKAACSGFSLKPTGVAARKAAKRLSVGLREMGVPVSPEGFPLILLEEEALRASLGNEGYHLTVDADGARLHAAGYTGFYYAAQTLLQLVEPGTDGLFSLPLVEIKDWPIKPIRGVHAYLPARKDLVFFKRFIEWMGRHKLNTIFLEIGGGMAFEKHPEINESWEKFCTEATAYPGGSDALQASQWFLKDSTHTELAGGSYLSLDEMARIADWCAANCVEIMPEVQSLSHAYYLVLAHPELAEVAEDPWPDNYCPSNPKSYELYFDVLGEVIDALRPKVVSIGHDEAYIFNFCPKCKSRDAAEIYGTDIIKAHDFLASKGIRTAMWGDKLLDIHHPDGQSYGGVEKQWTRFGRQFHMPATNRCVAMIPRDVLILDWYWSRCYESAGMLADKGFELIYGNFHGPTFKNWGKHSLNQSLLGGETSTWCAVDAYSLGRNGAFHNMLWGANNLWSDFDPDAGRERLIQDIAAVMREDRPKLTRAPAIVRDSTSGRQIPISLVPAGVQKLGDDCGDLPRGRQILNGVEFLIPDDSEQSGAIPAVNWHWRSSPPIPVNRKADALAFLHTSTLDLVHAPTYYSLGLGRNLVGEYTVTYEDGKKIGIPLEYGVNIDSWNISFIAGESGDMSASIGAYVYQADPVLAGKTKEGKPWTLFMYEWPNPRLDTPIREVWLTWEARYSKGDIQLIAMTVLA